MHIALFGATGGTGREIVRQAIDQGHQITALVRDPSRLSNEAGIEVIVGDVLDSEAVGSCIADSEAVICVLGSHGSASPIEASGTEHILEAMKASGVRRIVVVTSLGVGDSREQIPIAFRLIMDLTLKTIMAAKAEQERLVEASGLEWTIVRPGGLTDGPLTVSYRCGTDRETKSGRISRADVAHFVLRQLSDDTFLHQTAYVT